MSFWGREGAVDRGFSLIELMVVVLIIAILIGIAIPTFLGARRRGYETQIKTALRDAATPVESWAADHHGDYSGLDATGNSMFDDDLKDEGYLIPPYHQNFRIESTEKEYCIEARHRDLGADSEWRRSTLQSTIGQPQPTPDNCP